MKSFGEARNIALRTDADYGRFVDRGIEGTNRAIAIKLLRIMPPGMRGDFVYIQPNHHILSNRLGFESHVRFIPSKQARRRAASTPERGHAMKPNWPPQGGIGGAYLRYYSNQGANAGYGYATLPCDSYYTRGGGQGEAGNMYFNAYSPTSSGSIADAGITQNSTSITAPNYTAAQTSVAFVSVSGQPWDPGTWVNENQRWGCGYPLGIMYGTYLPNLATKAVSFLAVGVPDFDPTQVALPPAQSQWNQAAWDFFDTPSALLDNKLTTWNGTLSPCMGCSVARMYTISQNFAGSSFVKDGSCFGGCDYSPSSPGNDFGKWDETVVGNLAAPCQNTSSTTAECTIGYISSWIANEDDSGYGIFTGNNNDQQGLEGIVLDAGYAGVRNISTAGRFKYPLPPAPSAPCDPDANGFCYIGTPSSCVVKSAYGGPVVVALGGKIEVFKARYYATAKGQAFILDSKGSYTSTVATYPTSCPMASGDLSWSPANPEDKFNDPDLP